MMSPRKQPNTLFDSCLKSSMQLINTTCCVIAKRNSKNKFNEREKQTRILKNHLMSLLPPRFFDILCAARTRYPCRADPHIQLTVLMHPDMTVFRKCELDSGISQHYWMETLPNFNNLVVLDLKFICTDEILQIISVSCPFLEELNIVSGSAIKLLFNVSDAGLCSVAKLKQLRILSMDPPSENETGRCISEAGIIMLLSELPCLEELRIKSFRDNVSALITTNMEIGPLSLRKINCYSPTDMKKLAKLCPHLEELCIIYRFDTDNKLDLMSASDLHLTKLNFIQFSYSPSLEQLLVIKGRYLTHFSLWEIENSVTFDAVLTIGLYCPNLYSLSLQVQPNSLMVPQNFKRPSGIFTKLRTLTLDHFPIENTLLFFLECTRNLQKLCLRCQGKTNIDNTLLIALEKNYFKNVSFLWLHYTLLVSKEVVKRIIDECEKLTHLTVDLFTDMSDVRNYIHQNNLDLKLNSPPLVMANMIDLWDRVDW